MAWSERFPTQGLCTSPISIIDLSPQACLEIQSVVAKVQASSFPNDVPTSAHPTSRKLSDGNSRFDRFELSPPSQLHQFQPPFPILDVIAAVTRYRS